ncbi:galactokinase [Paenibacillus sp. MSJ-34]|uniref:galactokinase n=1 Tax=Paenibacillus sp. MSJ-34 TaxID=2841529 RepID=UPI001C101BFE|nr:galactokinase [Paenibacillus sp. MSJ-34]MBU5442590.1 galactokinase [Paenibacillus sp. MSJ-34]
MNQQLKEKLHRTFIEYYGSGDRPVNVFHAPGRVNLIGEHIDYNGGYVLPAALEFGTTLLIRARDDDRISLSSAQFPERAEFAYGQLPAAKSDQWTDYPTGVMVTLQQAGYPLSRGYDLLFHGEIPNGSGLSSSASIEVVTAFALLTLEGHPVDRKQISLWAQKAENAYVGVNCGIMDQFAVANGKKDHAILLMCDTLEFELVPFQTGNYKLVIGNTNKRRGLVDSKYNERRSECETAVNELKAAFPELTLLGQLNRDQFAQHAGLIASETVRKRAKHVIEENERVLQSVQKLKENDLAAFGRLMRESHLSLRDLYEVSCFELDVMVEEALKIPGVVGSRMTGAGFGGCTVSLVREDQVERFVREVGEAYEKATGLEAAFYVCGVGNGAEQIE